MIIILFSCNHAIIRWNLIVVNGDNVIVGTREGKLGWFDMDLSSKPYKILKCHPKYVTNVAFHRTYLLCNAPNLVYEITPPRPDLNLNPLIVPLEILRGHSSTYGRGVLLYGTPSMCRIYSMSCWHVTKATGAGLMIVKVEAHSRIFCETNQPRSASRNISLCLSMARERVGGYSEGEGGTTEIEATESEREKEKLGYETDGEGEGETTGRCERRRV
ncbi:hypothetical protein LguiA_002450 [Lonicera macranthoides]